MLGSITSGLCLGILLSMSGLVSAGMPPQARVVLEGLGVPWGMSWWGADQVVISERSGKLRLWTPGNNQLKSIDGLPDIAVTGQGGLLDVQAYPPLHWGRGEPKWLYLTYTKAVKGGATTTLARAKLKGSRLVEWQDLMVSRAASDGGRHFGSRIAFDGRGHVFFGIGDRGERDRAQQMNSHAGKVLRLNLDGSIPDDNPFISAKGALPEIYSLGHRNPQGLVYDEKKQRLWLMEHGPRGGDELNLVVAGRNYGWPVISYGKEYWGPLDVGEGTHKPGMEQPVHYYDPSIAPGSLMLYRGKAIEAWHNSLLSGALKLTHINQLQLAENAAKVVKEERWFKSLRERIRSLLEGPDGEVYFASDSGHIYLVSGN